MTKLGIRSDGVYLGKDHTVRHPELDSGSKTCLH
jgi:hypothetical protein